MTWPDPVLIMVVRSADGIPTCIVRLVCLNLSVLSFPKYTELSQYLFSSYHSFQQVNKMLSFYS